MELDGLTGFFADVIERLGAVGVGVLTFVETIVPPVPSEVLLPLAGFLAQQGRLSLAAVFVASVLGSAAGAWVFYAVGSAVGLRRSIDLLTRIPLVERDELERAATWFHRRGRWSVFYGRFVPGVRSLISLPAGADRMPWRTFMAATVAGSGLWNALLIGCGYLLADQWEQVGDVVGRFSDLVLLVIAATVVLVIARRILRRRQTRNHSSQP